MANMTEEITMSVPFRFTVGPNKKEFWMHRAVVAKQSPVLDRLVNGHFKEAQVLHAELEDVDEKTFHFFWQYAYSGAYGESSTAEEQPVQGTESGGKSLSFEMSEPHAVRAWQKFKSVANYENPPAGLVKSQTRYISRVYTRDLFISHARLYVFADCYQISKLASIAFYRLGEALVDHEVNDNTRSQDVVNLLGYCFEGTTPKILRYLMTLYAEANIQTLVKSTDFCEFLEDHGKLSTALIRAMVAPPVLSPAREPKNPCDDIIGLFVMYTQSDEEVRNLFADVDKSKIIEIEKWGANNRVVQFKTNEDRDAAMERLPDDIKNRPTLEARLRPVVKIFAPPARALSLLGTHGGRGSIRSGSLAAPHRRGTARLYGQV